MNISYNGRQYEYRTVVIFGQTLITVAEESLEKAMLSENGEFKTDDETIHTDELFAVYVPLDVLHSSDDELAEYIEENMYNNEPTEPNIQMPTNWFDAHVDTCDDPGDGCDEFYYKQKKYGIMVYDHYREYVTVIEGRRLDEPEFHINGNPNYEFDTNALLDATYSE